VAGLLPAHDRSNLLDQRHRAEEVRLEALARLIQINLFDPADQPVSGVVDQHVEPAAVGDDLAEHGLHPEPVAQLERVNGQQILESGHQLGVVRVVADGRVYAVTLGRQRPRRREPDALRGGAARDQDDARVGQVGH
jgi:hypothetical protein